MPSLESEYLDVGLAQIDCLLWDPSGTLLVAADEVKAL
jgi:hypothetical protein